MPIKIQCPQCRKALTVPDQLAGSTGKCPACGAQVSVPPSPPPPPADLVPAAPILTAMLVDDAPQFSSRTSASARQTVASKRNWRFWAATSAAAVFGLCVLAMLFDLVSASIDKARRTGAEREAADSGGPGGVDTVLTRMGYVRQECLVCRNSRSPAARRLYSDDHGFGLCDRCGAGYRATTRIVANGGTGSPGDQRAAQELSAAVQRYLGPNPTEQQQAFFVALLTFDSPEWNSMFGPVK